MANANGLSRVLIGFDGSRHARRAVAWLERVGAPRGGQAIVVCGVEPARVPAMGMLPAAVRDTLAGEAAELRAEICARAAKQAESASRCLAKAGWKVRVEVREGLPVDEILAAIRKHRADLLVVGERGVTGVKRVLLGSVSSHLLNESKIPVLVVK